MISAVLTRSVFLLVVVIVITSGCSGASKGQVAGQVMYENNPVQSGEVNLYSKQLGAGASAKLDGEGKFKLPGVLPTGEYVVYVTPNPIDPGDPSKPQPKQTPLKIPTKFQSMDTSKVKVQVAAGDNDLKVDLK